MMSDDVEFKITKSLVEDTFMEYRFTKKDVEDIAVLKERVSSLETEIICISKQLKYVAQKHGEYEKVFWELDRATKLNKQEIAKIEDGIEKSSISYFIKNNWWKIGGVILSMATIIGAIGDYLYHIHPAK